MSSASTIKMTARQFSHLGQDPPGVRLELVDGQIVVTPSPRSRHSYAVVALAHFLFDHARTHNLGTVLHDLDTYLGEYDVRRPDILFISKHRRHLIEEAVAGPPDLCVEVLSPGSESIDRRDKFEQYASAGVPHYWIVDPGQRTFECFQLSGSAYERIAIGSGEDVLNPPPFPNLNLPLAELWLPD